MVIIHFQPLERYPPVVNLLNHIASKEHGNEVLVLTTKNKGDLPAYKNKHIRIIRFHGITPDNHIVFRFYYYVLFYLGSIISLLFSGSRKILYYETISSFPAIIYYYITFKHSKILAHYHEYTSPLEYQTGMKLNRWFHSLEKKTMTDFVWMSHTNHKRLELFMNDNPIVTFKNTRILPNYPSNSWKSYAKSNGKLMEYPLKIVYVGSISLETMYFPEFMNWIATMKGKVIFDIYSFSYDPNFVTYYENLHCKYINLKGQFPYLEFPVKISQYDIGVILYKGANLNFIYNAPNKLFEYFSVGLDIWVPKEMTGCQPYIILNSYPKITMVDFNNLAQLPLDNIVSHEGLPYKASEFFCENVYEELTSFINDL